MRLNLEAVAAITRSVAREHASCVLSVASIRGGTDRVEVLVRMNDRVEAPDLMMLNVSRSEPSQFEEEIRSKLHEALSTRPKRP
jgi:CMP-2-keto-3-deoxyoctulosonic acid synthetase